MDDMPGLVGIVKTNENIDIDIRDLLTRMCRAVKHEEHYKIDTFIDDYVGIGRVDLGILNPEAQPIYNEDENLCIMMWGEIYDYQRLKEELIVRGHKFSVNNDPDFILHLYEECGKNFVHKLNGSFVLAILDKKKKEIMIVNDRYGLRPLYYSKRNGYLLFGSEVKAILEDETFERVIDEKAVADFFAYEYMLGNKTFFKEIRVLPPASVLKCSHKYFSIQQYWDFNYKDETFSEEYYVEELVKSFKKAVERVMQDEHRKGLLLSGGLDSRSILAATDGELYTFTFGERESQEAKIAEIVANKKKTKHQFLELKEDYISRFAENAVYLTDGMLNILHFHAISVLDEIRQKVDIILDGLAMDLTLGGSYLAGELFGAKEENFPQILLKKLIICLQKIWHKKYFLRSFIKKLEVKLLNL